MMNFLRRQEFEKMSIFAELRVELVIHAYTISENDLLNFFSAFCDYLVINNFEIYWFSDKYSCYDSNNHIELFKFGKNLQGNIFISFATSSLHAQNEPLRAIVGEFCLDWELQ